VIIAIHNFGFMEHSSNKKMNRKGICYDVGRVIMGENQRPHFDPYIVRRELELLILADGLGDHVS